MCWIDNDDNDISVKLQGRPQDLGGGGQEFFFQIWEFACRALLGGPGACSSEKNF